MGAGDNWDHNERTVDGRRATHAMTSILVSPKTAEELIFPHIPRVPERTFDIQYVPGGSLSYVLPYRKPLRRPKPKHQPSATIDEIEAPSADTHNAEMTELSYNVATSGYFCDDQDIGILPWGPFHAPLASQVKLQVSNTAFSPIIMAPPTDQSPIYTTLKRMKEAFGAL